MASYDLRGHSFTRPVRLLLHGTYGVTPSRDPWGRSFTGSMGSLFHVTYGVSLHGVGYYVRMSHTALKRVPRMLALKPDASVLVAGSSCSGSCMPVLLFTRHGYAHFQAAGLYTRLGLARYCASQSDVVLSALK